jgi:hypothetical protein
MPLVITQKDKKSIPNSQRLKIQEDNRYSKQQHIWRQVFWSK